MEKKNPIEEAKRYVENAKNILLEHGELDIDTKAYADRKYVKMAGNTLWNGCLLALEAVFHLRQGKGRPSIEKYKEVISGRDKKLLSFVNYGYEIMHLYMGYDGNQAKAVSDVGFQTANSIISRCEQMMAK
ncbi:MAG: DUF5618 family protein [Bacteroidales bacterium]|nr:DUF5618 family protein [Bacteroidales bacterium]